MGELLPWVDLKGQGDGGVGICIYRESFNYHEGPSYRRLKYSMPTYILAQTEEFFFSYYFKPNYFECKSLIEYILETKRAANLSLIHLIMLELLVSQTFCPPILESLLLVSPWMGPNGSQRSREPIDVFYRIPFSREESVMEKGVELIWRRTEHTQCISSHFYRTLSFSCHWLELSHVTHGEYVFKIRLALITAKC